jgi:hypothetical protein
MKVFQLRFSIDVSTNKKKDISKKNLSESLRHHIQRLILYNNLLESKNDFTTKNRVITKTREL